MPTDISAVVKLFMEFSKCPSAKGLFCETNPIQFHLILNTTQQMSGKDVHYMLQLSNILHDKMTKNDYCNFSLRKLTTLWSK